MGPGIRPSSLRLFFFLIHIVFPIVANLVASVGGFFLEILLQFSDYRIISRHVEPHSTEIMIVSFAVPITLMSIYNGPIIRDLAKIKHLPAFGALSKKLMIKSPLAVGIISITGWATSIVAQLMILVSVIGTDALEHILLTMVYMVVSAILCMTITYYGVEYFDRRFLIAAFFPDGHIAAYNSRPRMSVKMKFMIFFISISLYPILLMLGFMLSLMERVSPSREYTVTLAVVLTVVVLVCLAITLLIAGSFQSPIGELTAAARDIRHGRYGVTARVRTSDELGLLAETFNEMSAGLAEMEAVREQARIAEMERASLEQEIMLARKIQFSLLPHRLPSTPRARVAYKYVPMQAVGGDLVDVIHCREEGIIGLFICDVAGHGVPAALTASMVKMALATWKDTIGSPAATLEKVRASLSGKLGDSFLTAGIAVVDLGGGRVTTARAGHPPVMLVRKNGKVEMLNPPGRMISDSVPARFVDASAALEKGDRVVLYTDGIIEASREGALFGEDAFADLMMKSAGRDPDDVCVSVYEHLLTYSRSDHLEDDFTIAVMEITGAGEAGI